MPYDLEYRATFLNVEGLTIRVTISDTTTYAEEPSYPPISLNDSNDKLPDSPLVISIVDTEQDKFTPIRAKRLTFRFFSQDGITMSTFATGEDNRWRVEAKIVDTNYILFLGFLVMDDITEPLLPVEMYTVTLTASDGLGTLSTVPLVDNDDKNPRAYFKLIQYLTWALRKTGLTLPIYLMDNVTPEEGVVAESFFGLHYLHSKTFEAAINETENCYSVIKKILGEQCFLSQENGRWYIMRIDEYEDRLAKMQIWEDVGYASLTGSTTMELRKYIGLDEKMYLRDAATEVGMIRPKKSVTENYNYEYPLEIIDNIDFERGTVERAGGTATEKTYELEDWVLTRSPGTVTSEAYIKRVFEDGYEKERYLVITPQANMASPWDHVLCNPIPVHKNDKVSFSADFRYPTNWSTGSTTNPRLIKLFIIKTNGDYIYWDGTQWGGGPGPNNNIVAAQVSWDTVAVDETEWQTATVETTPFPEDGDLYIGLFNANTVSDMDRDIYWQNLNLTYKPFINGSYQKYKGQHHKVTQDGEYKAIRENDVFVSDSPKKLFKGALHLFDGAYKLANKYYSGAVFPTTPTAEYMHPLGHLQVFDVWNQVNRAFRTLDIRVQGLITNATPISVINKYVISDISFHTYQKHFLLLHYDMDVKKCNWSGTVVEVMDLTIEKDYASEREFKYISER